MNDTHVNESILSEEILEDQKKNRIDHMTYLPGMEDIGSEIMDQVIEAMEAYDYDSYLAERGTYFAVDEKYPNKSCRTESELLQRIKNVDYAAERANTKRFRDEFVQYGVGATETCINAVFGG